MCTGRRYKVERYLLLSNDAEQVLISLDRSRKLEFLSADLLKKFPEIRHQSIVDNILIQQRDRILQSDELSCLKATEPKHSVNELVQLEKVVVSREGI